MNPLTEVRPPMPDWSRPGETWRVEPERYLEAAEGGVCSVREGPRARRVSCHRESVAATRSYFTICGEHLREQKMWIEGGRVVSWRLSP